MPAPDVIVTAPLPPFLYEPLKADYRCHDYYQSSHKPGLLAAEGQRIRGLVQGGGTVTPTDAARPACRSSRSSRCSASATTACRSTTAAGAASR